MISTDAGNGLPILYSFRRCPYAIRARLAVRVSGAVVTLREVVLRNKPAALVAASPKATVPVLQLPDGAVLDQSLDIMRWALRLNDPQGWLRFEDHAEAHALIALNDGPFKQALDRYKYSPRDPQHPAHPAHPVHPTRADRDEAVELMLAPLNARLAGHGFLLCDTPSLADMAIVPFVRQFAAVDSAWFDSAPLPQLQVWLKRLTASPLFVSVMPHHVPWQPDDADVVF